MKAGGNADLYAWMLEHLSHTAQQGLRKLLARAGWFVPCWTSVGLPKMPPWIFKSPIKSQYSQFIVNFLPGACGYHSADPTADPHRSNLHPHMADLQAKRAPQPKPLQEPEQDPQDAASPMLCAVVSAV